MADAVADRPVAPAAPGATVTHEGVTVETNYGSEAELRESLGAPPRDPKPGNAPSASDPTPQAAQPETPPSPKDAPDDAEPRRVKASEAAKRINQLVWEREEAKRAAAKAEAEKAQAAKPSTDDPEPNPTDAAKYPEGQFDRQYLKDQARWEARQEFRARQREVAESRAKAAAEDAKARIEAAHQARLSAFQERIAEARATDAEFDQKTAWAADQFTTDSPLTDALIDAPDAPGILAHLNAHRSVLGQIQRVDPRLAGAIFSTPEAVKLLTHFQQAPKELLALNAMDPISALLDLGGTIARLSSARTAAPRESAPAPRSTTAHPPVNSPSGSHSAAADGPPDPATCSQKDWDDYWNAQERAQRQSRRAG